MDVTSSSEGTPWFGVFVWGTTTYNALSTVVKILYKVYPNYYTKFILLGECDLPSGLWTAAEPGAILEDEHSTTFKPSLTSGTHSRCFCFPQPSQPMTASTRRDTLCPAELWASQHSKITLLTLQQLCKQLPLICIIANWVFNRFHRYTDTQLPTSSQARALQGSWE